MTEEKKCKCRPTMVRGTEFLYPADMCEEHRIAWQTRHDESARAAAERRAKLNEEPQT